MLIQVYQTIYSFRGLFWALLLPLWIHLKWCNQDKQCSWLVWLKEALSLIFQQFNKLWYPYKSYNTYARSSWLKRKPAKLTMIIYWVYWKTSLTDQQIHILTYFITENLHALVDWDKIPSTCTIELLVTPW